MKRISTTEIAKICGVSQGTVDRALNNRTGINEKTKEKILKVAKEFGYRPNIHACSIAGGKSHLIGVVVFDLHNEYFLDLLMDIEKYCSSIGYSAVVMFSDKSLEREIDCIRNLYHMAVDGIILCPINNGEEYENFLASLNIPIITVGNKINNTPHIGIDNALAVKEVVELVAKAGYKKLIYIKPELKQRNIFAQAERLDSFISTCEKANIQYVVTDLKNAENEISANMNCALICPTDIYAIKLLPIAKKHKAGIIGFDNLHLIDELNLRLDSVAYDVSQTAETAVNFIVNKTPADKIIPHNIIKRGSV